MAQTPLDAANVDLKAINDDFYHRLCGGRLQPVLDLLAYLQHDTDCWLEITTLLIPGENDSDAELQALSAWIARELGPDVPLHFTAFHPDWRLRDRPATPPATLQRARQIAMAAGLHHVYTGNVHDAAGGTTSCPQCDTALIVRDWYDIRRYALTADGCCPKCATPLAGRFAARLGGKGQASGPRRVPVSIKAY